MRRVDMWECIIAVSRASNRKLSSYRVAAALDKLARIAKTLTRYYVWQCNEDTSGHTCRACGGNQDVPHTYTRCAGAKVYELQSRAERLGASIGIHVENQTDPRGASIKLFLNAKDAEQGRGCLGVFS